MSGAGAGRRLRPPAVDTPLDRAWRRRQWRLQNAHDDWALHAADDEPRAAIHRAAGLVRLRRQSVRDAVRACRRAAGCGGRPADIRHARDDVTAAFLDYRRATAALAAAVAAFVRRNRNHGARPDVVAGANTRDDMATRPMESSGIAVR